MPESWPAAAAASRPSWTTPGRSRARRGADRARGGAGSSSAGPTFFWRGWIPTSPAGSTSACPISSRGGLALLTKRLLRQRNEVTLHARGFAFHVRALVNLVQVRADARQHPPRTHRCKVLVLHGV